MELYKKHRPKKFNQVYGNKAVVRSLLAKCKANDVPHAIMLTGETGCCKTTIARILKTKLGCLGSIKGEGDYREINASEDRGIKMIRQINDTIRASPFGKARLWVIDEAQGLTTPAQNALLKFLEDPPDTAYIILCTTNPEKIIKTIHSRCTQYKVAPLTQEELIELMASILKKEKVKTVSKEVLERIYEVSEGLPRKALVLLDGVYRMKSEEQMLETIQKSESRRQAIEIAREMIKPKPKWAVVKDMLKAIEEEPETVRRIILAYASSVCLGGGPLSKRASVLYDAFRDMFLNGKPDLVFACFITCAGT